MAAAAAAAATFAESVGAVAVGSCDVIGCSCGCCGSVGIMFVVGVADASLVAGTVVVGDDVLVPFVLTLIAIGVIFGSFSSVVGVDVCCCCSVCSAAEAGSLSVSSASFAVSVSDAAAEATAAAAAATAPAGSSALEGGCVGLGSAIGILVTGDEAD